MARADGSFDEQLLRSGCGKSALQFPERRDRTRTRGNDSIPARCRWTRRRSATIRGSTAGAVERDGAERWHVVGADRLLLADLAEIDRRIDELVEPHPGSSGDQPTGRAERLAAVDRGASHENAAGVDPEGEPLRALASAQHCGATRAHRADRFHVHLVQLRSAGELARGLVDEDLVAPGCCQRVALGLGVLVAGGDPPVADPHGRNVS